MNQEFEPGKEKSDSKSPATTSRLELPEKLDDPEVLRAFFTPEIVQKRLIYCPQINNDLTDDWGMFGYSQGFIYIIEKRHNDTTTFNEDMWQLGRTDKGLELGDHFMRYIPHYDFFPRTMFNANIIREEVDRRVFSAFCEALNISSEQLASLDIKDPGLADFYEYLGIDPDNVTELRLESEQEQDPADWWKQDQDQGQNQD